MKGYRGVAVPQKDAAQAGYAGLLATWKQF